MRTSENSIIYKNDEPAIKRVVRLTFSHFPVDLFTINAGL